MSWKQVVEKLRARKIIVVLCRWEVDGVNGTCQAPIEHAIHALICNRENFQEEQEYSETQLH
jgi:hypothetical protein